MLSTGVRTPIGIKIMARICRRSRSWVSTSNAAERCPGTKSVFAERTAGGYFIDFKLKRSELARYGLTIDQANSIVMSAIGVRTSQPPLKDVNVTGQCPVFQRISDDLEKLRRVFVPVQSGAPASASGMGGMVDYLFRRRGVTHVPSRAGRNLSQDGPSMIATRMDVFPAMFRRP